MNQKRNSFLICCKILAWVASLILISSLMLPAHSQDFDCADKDRPLTLTNPPMTGFDIQELQFRLNDLGFNPGKPDGIFDKQTTSAVMEFQVENNIKADGKVGPQTWQTLAQGAEKPVTSQPLPPPEGQLEIVIELDKRLLTVYEDGKLYHKFSVAIGKSDTPSPVGEWKVISKGVHWGGGFGTRWMGLNVPWGIYGIHGTNKPYSIGSAASHGCFRMYNRDAEQLYSWVKVGTPVKVLGPERSFGSRKLKKGVTGGDVVTVQSRLRQQGFYLFGPSDGRYGVMSMTATCYFQMLNYLPATGELDAMEFKLLDISPGTKQKTLPNPK